MASGVTYAALPLVAVVPAAIDFASGLVIRSAAKEVVVAAGVAANDAAWATGFSSLVAQAAAFVGLGVVAGNVGDEGEAYQVPVRQVAIPATVPVYSDPGTSGDPLPLGTNGLMYKVTTTSGASATVSISGSNSTDGLLHTYSFGATLYTLSELQSILNDLRSYQKTYGYYYESDSTFYAPQPSSSYGNPVPVSIGSKYARRGEFGASSASGHAYYYLVPYSVEPTDGKKRFKMVSTGFTPDTTDPDWTQQEISQIGTVSHLVFSGTNASGQAVRTDVIKQENGVNLQSVIQTSQLGVLHRAVALNTSAVPVSVTETVLDGVTNDTAYEVYPNLLPAGQGSTGASSGSVTVNTCGLPGQPACVIDDSAFADKATATIAPLDAIAVAAGQTDQQIAGIENEAPPIDAGWLPSLFPGDPVSCAPLKIEMLNAGTGFMSGRLSMSEEWDFCFIAGYVRDILGWVFSVITVLVIWHTFFNEGARR